MYNRLLEQGRSKKILCPSNINSRTAEPDTNGKKCSQDLNDFLVVSKIQGVEPQHVIDDGIDEDVIAAINSLLEEELADQNDLLKENDELVKKQYQILHADERGRKAINAEIAEIKKKQEERSRALKARKHALEVEKARAKRISSLPPPLPKSVRLLLKEERNKIFDSPQSQANEVIPNEPEDEIMEFDDKENRLLSEEQRIAIEKLKEERNMKAQQRFNEALKKDRQRKEQDEFLKKIEDAERLHRREIAKNVSEKGTKMPCFYPDRLQNMMKQADMENAAENVCKKNSSKEHAIEDIEGYEDLWEKKYEKVNSNSEEKLIDCIPSFVKENYEYLLKDEPEYKIGNRFSDSNDSANELDLAFINSPPVVSPERNVGAPKKEQFDKAVAADILKPPVEDKAVEANITTFQSPPPVDYWNAGVVTFKHRNMGSNYRFFKDNDLAPPKDNYAYFRSNNNKPRCDNWSSSSYYSLPSNHGMPNIDHFCDPRSSCDICTAEKNVYSYNSHLQNNSPIKNIVENEYSENTPCEDTQNVVSTKKSSLLSSYVKQLAEKYLVDKSISSVINKSNFKQNIAISNSQNTPSHSQSEEKVVHSDIEFNANATNMQDFTFNSPAYPKLDQQNQESLKIASKPKAGMQMEPEKLAKSPISEKTDKLSAEDNLNLESSKFKKYGLTDECAQEAEAARIRLIKEIVFRNSSKSISGLSTKVHVSSLESEKPDIFLVQSEVPHVYHELSTIQEMDSALTSETPHISYSESLLEQKSMKTKSISKDISKEALEEDCSDTISLLDVPPSQTTELAKNICFVSSSENSVQSQLATEESKISSASSKLDKSNMSVPLQTHDVPPLDSLSESSLSLVSSCKATLTPKTLFNSSSSSVVSIPHESTPHMQDEKRLHNYFKDISNIQQKKPTSNIISMTQDEAFAALGRNFEKKIREKKETLLPKSESSINTHSTDEQLISSTNIFNPMTLHSDISSPEATTAVNAVLEKHSSNIELHKPIIFNLTPAAKVSEFFEETRNSRNFSPLSTCSKISTSSSMEHMSNKKSHKPIPFDSIPAAKVPEIFEETGSSTNFTPLSTCSKISTPSSMEHISNRKLGEFSDSGSTFKALSPVSNISTPSSSDGKSHDHFQSPDSVNSINFKPMTLCFNISTPCSERTRSDDPEVLRKTKSNQEQFEFQSIPSITCNVTIHAESSKLNSSLSGNTEIPELRASTNVNSSDLFLPFFSTKPQTTFSKLIENRNLTKKRIHPCKSGFFVPQIHISEHSTVNDVSKAEVPEAYSQEEIGNIKMGSQQKTGNACLMGEKEKILCHPVLTADSVTHSSKNTMEKRMHATVECKLEDPSQTEVNKLSSPNKAQFIPHPLRKSNSLQSIASYSSNENLTEMFSGSKITYQSTPVKAFDSIEEKGILDEPDLTLVSLISCESTLPEKPRADLETGSINENLDHTLHVIEDTPPPCEDKTVITSSVGPFQTDCVDSPSMISFLQHEKGCLAQANAQEKEMKLKDSKSEYKKRTKRLWDNLEEVQKKNTLESKKKQFALNRLKAKEFSKKVTPKKKENDKNKE